ncbi:helix-turn-helix domain-containing protein [Levilactobacillus angrenensis]|uniref:Helix-turn-helix domain-containing protein n=1 Tax=Levilactobacillus angrenensis TaxID=2486020 RepID=A0ABW1UCI0_9LACO|nr:helix-turn-helix domain-containing protein [Levilactobacillus angrenensis]
MRKKFFNPELATTDWYTEVWRVELVQVKDVPALLVRNHYWQDAAGELWGDFDHPMENVRASFAAYRAKKGYMTPDEIRSLRKGLDLSVRKFAERLGIAPSTLTQIENNQRVQVKYQELLFESARDYYQAAGRLPARWSADDNELVDDLAINSVYRTTPITRYQIPQNVRKSMSNKTFRISSEWGELA